MPLRCLPIALALALCLPRLAPAKAWLFVSLLREKTIVTYERNATTGRLTRVAETQCPAEPGMLVLSPDQRTLFAAFRSTGQLASFRFDRSTGRLSLLRVVEGGQDPAYLLVDKRGRFLLTAYYIANKVTSHAIGRDGALSPLPVQSVPTAQHAHGIEMDAENRMAFVTHTGANRIYQFRFDAVTGKLASSDPPYLSAGPGEEPRHIAIHPSDRWTYANHEAGDSLGVYRVDATAATLSHVQTVSTLPADFDGAGNSTARCEISDDGRFVYVANRGHHSIAGFAIDQESGRVRALGHWPTEPTPRSFSLTPDAQFLYAAGQDSGKIATYRIQADGYLRRIATTDSGPMPWCVLAVDTQRASK